ncbi:hypothetical protein CISIN_1g037246mg [Citrus sinensis]|uniref:Subtilisin-like protease fibronectin type-III domain-containing protein n=1 Tax=Citrus sinensis TaxID=2711 RepID=A0A067FKN4_CITSI|nr:hypothetical protein CISIN_1g037246mg [Citrus sinensis]
MLKMLMQVYIVYMGSLPERGMDGVVSVFPRKMLQLQTTRSWDFMGFAETVKRNPSVESDIVIGVLDSGIWPELESFNDEGLSDPPKKWKGVCEGGKNFTCNSFEGNAPLVYGKLNRTGCPEFASRNPQAYISKSEAANVSGAPGVPDFSSRGPNTIIPDIVKPDISAPGVEILAGFSPAVEPSLLPGDKRSVKYSILSGTSVACSHVTGAAAYVKSFHPDWSPSSIKSALMTTAWSINATSNPGGEFAFGAGHIDPVKAISPGLVYEAFADDYVKFLCSLGYDTRKLQAITKDSSTCPSETKGTPKDLNYPSMAARVQENKPFAVNFSRTVTNVGQGNSKYKAKVTVDPKIKINVAPSDLSFKSLKEKQSFVVTVSGVGLKENSMVSASLVWSDGTYNVRSPIVLYTNKGDSDPTSATVSSVAPCVLTLGASHVDCQIVDKVVLRNGKFYQFTIGNSANSFELPGSELPLVYGKDVISLCRKHIHKNKYGILDFKLI